MTFIGVEVGARPLGHRLVRIAGTGQCTVGATTTSTPALVAYLRDTLIPRLVAFIAGVSETRVTRQWAEGERDIGSSEREQRLRATTHVTRLIADTFDARTAQAWMQGMDPMLNDRSPARVLRHATVGPERVAVLASARRSIVQ